MFAVKKDFGAADVERYVERISEVRRLPVAAFLGPNEKASFATALSAALGEARRGPTRTVLS